MLSKAAICPLCRTLFDNGVPPLGFYDDDSLIDEANIIMFEAAEAGYEDIVRLMLFQGADNYNEAMINAARTGHEGIVRLMLKKGTNGYNQALMYAQKYQHECIVRLMQNRMN